MREIEFRGQNINGYWAYGNLAIIKEKLDRAEIGTYISNSAGAPFAYQVRPETVGQYTGLKDKNGNKIFEGDIVTAFSNINKYTDSFAGDVEPTFCFTSIVYDGACFKTTYKGEPSYVLNENGSSLVMHMEVIGNIHENPDLLEVAE
ncbi:hypothetical protein OJ633_000512 [Listeria monocytogenes]|nr:hypothetical protein [Listeria monocytogenes]EKA2553120.1 hypothetical protein [Listeria monocytogenes]EKA2556278.1 hypothetical protein [Listeria monocytogenes]EKA2559402.1 hypothetical protein [Listeria monocytogenes]EKA2562570.1 hypothetical protein [Listeria monocytogenes]